MMKQSVYDVIVVGAGPAGLMLAIDLAAKGVKCKIIEKRKNRSVSSRAFGLLAHTLELLDIHDLASPLVNQGILLREVPLGIKNQYLDLGRIKSETKFPFMLSISQTETEIFLENHALKMGVLIEKGVEVVDLTQNDDYVDLTILKENKKVNEQATYVIGADGKNSTIRRLVDIDSHGFIYHKVIMHGDVLFSDEQRPATFSRLSRHGMIAYFKLPMTDCYRLLVLDHRKMDTPIHDRNLELSDFIESANYLAGINLNIKGSLWHTQFVSVHKHADTYRSKRIFLIGDAAHVHPPAGGQGLQTAVQDAFNLGWKLASQLRERPRHALLDSYEYERRPLIEKSLRKSRYLFKYEISKSLVIFCLRIILLHAIRLPILQKAILINLSFMNARHKLWSEQKRSIIGQHAYRYQFVNLEGENISVNSYLKHGTFLLIVNTDSYKTEWQHIQVGYRQSLAIVFGQIKGNSKFNLVLIRPDGLIAYADKNITLNKRLSRTFEYWMGEMYA